MKKMVLCASGRQIEHCSCRKGDLFAYAGRPARSAQRIRRLQFRLVVGRAQVVLVVVDNGAWIDRVAQMLRLAELSRA